MTFFRAPIALAVLAAGLVPPAPAMATCAVCSCSTSVTNLNFGTYNPTSSTATTANATVSVNCFSVLVLMIGTVDVALSAGGSGVATSRKMVNGNSQLSYNAYQDNAYATVWGSGGAGGLLETLTISGLFTYNANRTVYGRIPARQWVRPGVYTDTLVVTVSY